MLSPSSSAWIEAGGLGDFGSAYLLTSELVSVLCSWGDWTEEDCHVGDIWEWDDGVFQTHRR